MCCLNLRAILLNFVRNPPAPGRALATLLGNGQCDTAADPIEAYQAAIDTDTKILVGLWASAGRYVFENELRALTTAVFTLGAAFTDRVIGISVGSEDLYRSSALGIASNAGDGAAVAEILEYIGMLRDWTRGTLLEGKPITHVDTWSAWIQPESSGVIAAIDFLGHNSFPYFEGAVPNAIETASDHFWWAVGVTESVAQGKPVWVTETGWPDSTRDYVAGPVFHDAVPSIENAQTYWKTIGCSLFGKRNIFWYTLLDGAMTDSDISFGITPASSTIPKFDLACY
ncbi:hypothetical protein O1611_g6088 [Lasiodiplodia mahajangana]|uniref:Uncharacterized protein n=1 Tax=Lasiodiplodia mahajangana TaxID=1108764 RepID=A0ACC2JJK6_9PEZI|nr:hypothetical protein O1611_g6088 [Lasiodiplodia mahajangana]